MTNLTMENLHGFEFIKQGYQINKDYLQASSPIIFENQIHYKNKLGQLFRMFQKQVDPELDSINGSQYSGYQRSKLFARVIKLNHIKPYKI